MKTKLISLKTVLLTVIVLFVFSASANAQVETKITQNLTINGGRWNKVLRNGDPVTIFSYKQDGDTHTFGIYSDDYAGEIDLRGIPFNVDSKQLKKLPKKSKKGLKTYTPIACAKARKKALAGEYKTIATDMILSNEMGVSVSPKDHITVVGYKVAHSYAGLTTNYYYAIVKDDAAGYCHSYDLDKITINNVPLPFLPRTDDPQVIAFIENAKRNITERKNAESRAWYAKQEKLAAERQAKREAEREEEKRLEAEYQAYRDSMAAAKVEQDMAEMKRCAPAIIKVGGWYRDSANGIEVDITFTNCTSQKVKYVYFRGYFLNAVGDKCRNDITRSTEWKYRGVGPIDAMPKELQKNYYPNVEFWRFGNPKFYSSIAHTFRLSSVTIEYMNGKKTTLSGAELKKRVKYESFWN